jgi:hypothetical protein
MLFELDITWDITLVGIGSLLAGIGSFLAGYAALKRAGKEPKKPVTSETVVASVDTEEADDTT